MRHNEGGSFLSASGFLCLLHTLGKLPVRTTSDALTGRTAAVCHGWSVRTLTKQTNRKKEITAGALGAESGSAVCRSSRSFATRLLLWSLRGFRVWIHIRFGHLDPEVASLCALLFLHYWHVIDQTHVLVSFENGGHIFVGHPESWLLVPDFQTSSYSNADIRKWTMFYFNWYLIIFLNSWSIIDF